MNKFLLIACITVFTISAEKGFSKTIATNFSTLSKDSLPSGGIHIIDGNKNSLGIDDANGKDILLSNVDLKRLLQMVISKQTSSSDSIIGIQLMQGSNGGGAAIQVENYLNANGFRIASHGQTLGTLFNGISIYREPLPFGIQIIFGTLVPSTTAQ